MALEDILTQAASATTQMTPSQSGGGGLTSFGPTPIQQPPPPVRFQPPQIEHAKAGNEFQTVSGRKRADKQALFHGVAAMIKSGTDFVQAKKMRALTMDIGHLMEAQQGYQEAQQSGDKEAMAQNAAIINDIAKDPKKLKQLQKAFNIDLFGDGKNKAENMALTEAWKQFSQKQQAGDKTALNPMAQKLMQQQASRIQLSPEAQAQAMAIKAGLVPKAEEILKANVENYKAIQTAKTQEERTAAINRAADLRLQGEHERSGALINAANVRALGPQLAADINGRYKLKIASMVSATWDKRIAAMKDIAEKKTANPIFKQLYQDSVSYNTELAKLALESKNAQVELDKKGSSFLGIKFGAATDADSKILRNKIFTNNLRMKDLQSSLDNIHQRMDVLNKVGVNVGMGGSNEADDVKDVSDADVPEN